MTANPISQILEGKTVVVTGASDGIGKAAVRAFVALGASVVMVGRNEAKTIAAAQSIMSTAGRRAITWEIADLSEQHEVIDLAARLRARLPRIDVLANNAGGLFLDRSTTSEGFERTFALNHLNYFTLTLQLLPALYAASAADSPSRVINVSSRAHENASPKLDDLQAVRDYGGWKQYSNSKLFNIWFTRSLAKRVDRTRIITHTMHPGVVSTKFATNNGFMGRLQRRVMDLVSVSPEKGADTLVWLSTSDEARSSSGDYWVKRRQRTPSKAARDDVRAEQLWVETERLTGLDADAMIKNAEAHAVA